MGPITFRDQEGEEKSLLDGSPGLLLRLFAEAWRLRAERAAIERAQAQGLLNKNQQVCSQQARRLFATKRKKRLQHVEKQAFMRFFTGLPHRGHSAGAGAGGWSVSIGLRMPGLCPPSLVGMSRPAGAARHMYADIQDQGLAIGLYECQGAREGQTDSNEYGQSSGRNMSMIEMPIWGPGNRC